MRHLESNSESPRLLSEALPSLTTLSNSNNLELQRSAALAFAEVSEKSTFFISISTKKERKKENFVLEVKLMWKTITFILLNIIIAPGPIKKDVLEPIFLLLKSNDIEVQRAAAAALGNLAVNGLFLFFCNCFNLNLNYKNQ